MHAWRIGCSPRPGAAGPRSNVRRRASRVILRPALPRPRRARPALGRSAAARRGDRRRKRRASVPRRPVGGGEWKAEAETCGRPAGRDAAAGRRRGDAPGRGYGAVRPTSWSPASAAGGPPPQERGRDASACLVFEPTPAARDAEPGRGSPSDRPRRRPAGPRATPVPPANSHDEVFFIIANPGSRDWQFRRMDGVRPMLILHAARSETSSNSWKLSVMRVASLSA